jgi:hypothetical protein
VKPRILLMRLLSAAHDFVAPPYRPELYYMRGQGPTYQRRAVMVESKSVLPLLRSRKIR